LLTRRWFAALRLRTSLGFERKGRKEIFYLKRTIHDACDDVNGEILT
jgi:hypothetical protein